MNKRIYEFALQAASDTRLQHGNPYWYISEEFPEDTTWREKFAQLIIRECVQTLIDNTPERYTNEAAEEDWDKGYDRAMKDCVHHIQEHFGVDE